MVVLQCTPSCEMLQSQQELQRIWQKVLRYFPCANPGETIEMMCVSLSDCGAQIVQIAALFFKALYTAGNKDSFIPTYDQ